MEDNNGGDKEKLRLRESMRIRLEEESRKFKLQEELKPLTWQDVSITKFLENDPPEPKYLFNQILLKGIVGGFLATGGTGKSFLLKTLAISLASGKTFGPFEPVAKSKVLYVSSEDPTFELHRRINLIAKSMNLLHSNDLRQNLAIYPGIGKIEPLLMLDGKGNPTTTKFYNWLQQGIENLKINVLILDPLSRFFGLNENDIAHGTAWIQCLEKLSRKYDLTILFAHHEPKSASQNKNLRESTGRGASSIRDGIRWSLSLREMRSEDAERFDVNARDYIELDISKTNFTTTLPNSLFLKRNTGGILEPVYLRQDRLQKFSEVLFQEISQLTEDTTVSRSDLVLQKESSREIVKSLKALSGFKHKENMSQVIDYALKNGLLYEKEIFTRGRPKMILKVRQNLGKNS